MFCSYHRVSRWGTKSQYIISSSRARTFVWMPQKPGVVKLFVRLLCSTQCRLARAISQTLMGWMRCCMLCLNDLVCVATARPANQLTAQPTLAIILLFLLPQYYHTIVEAQSRPRGCGPFAHEIRNSGVWIVYTPCVTIAWSRHKSLTQRSRYKPNWPRSIFPFTVGKSEHMPNPAIHMATCMQRKPPPFTIPPSFVNRLREALD